MGRIMEFTKNKQKRRTINNWRLYFQVTTISEIANYSGDTLQQETINKNKLNNFKH
jgi:hypothetical protein